MIYVAWGLGYTTAYSFVNGLGMFRPGWPARRTLRFKIWGLGCKR